ncbi:immunoglobulin-like domain-containing protein [uncultured Thomasclavelia sp.]|uniref:immunoglobulin-like domain-containing protein n=1 Tax=uncultured Thomasclavelia sp. TaxID=3025759 RepID=UPI0025D1A051|nr:immunoglobulin-like domain-containing protein [uncultured Thomasclavelia sp.]
MKNRIIAVILSFFIVINTVLIACALNVTPLTVKREVFVYEYGSAISTAPQDYINANESILEQVTLNFSNLKNEIGTYHVSATYLGEEYPFVIEIVDTTKPVFTLKAVTFNVDLNKEIYAIDLIEEVEDNSDYTAYFIDENGDKSLSRSYSEKGSYVENILVADSAGNESSSLRVKIVAGQNGNNPTLSGIDDIEVLKDTSFDPLKDVKATDGSGNDITSNIKILKNNVDTSEVGEYEVIYSVTNDKGNTLQRTRKVTVVKTEKTGD